MNILGAVILSGLLGKLINVLQKKAYDNRLEVADGGWDPFPTRTTWDEWHRENMRKCGMDYE